MRARPAADPPLTVPGRQTALVCPLCRVRYLRLMEATYYQCPACGVVRPHPAA